ncbi:MAG: hypothetical protein ABI333_02700 [bacterium]
MPREPKEETKAMEEIAYHLFVRGFLSIMEIKALIKEGYIKYQSRYLYDPLEKEWNILSASSTAPKRRTWEYDNWEYDYSSKDRVVSEFLEIFEARTGEESDDDDEPLPSMTPTVADANALQKRVRPRLEKSRPLFQEALSILEPGARQWQQAAQTLVRMHVDQRYERVAALVDQDKGPFPVLWDFLAYDGYVIPEFGGPVISAYKKVLRGDVVENLGDHRWILTQQEVRDVYLLVQAQVGVARAFARMIRENRELFARGLGQGFHSAAFRCAALVYASRRWMDSPNTPPAEGERVPTWIDIFELATPAAFTIAFHMDDTAVRGFLRHVFRVTQEKHNTLSQLFLGVLFRECGRFVRDIDKRDYVEKTKGQVLSSSRDVLDSEDIVARQREAAVADPFWGPFFKSLPEEKWQRFIRAWWEALTYDCVGLGALWLKEETRWSRRIIGYEAFVDPERFQESVDFALEDFYSLYCPRIWDS